MRKWLRWIITIAILGMAAKYGFSWYESLSKKTPPVFKTEVVLRGDIVAAISATGTIEPEDLIDVGAQVAGKVIEFGRDKRGKSIDYGSEVTAGMILARIDETIYLADLRTAEAALHKTEADLENSKAALKQLQAKLEQARRNWERAQKLGPSEALARVTYDNYRSAFEIAEADVQVGNVVIQQAQAGVGQAQANVNKARQNLSYCIIKSPVNGVIIDRRVNIGQTVVSSLSAPSLFLIAKDLRRVQIWVAVNEADIGNIYPGQPVTFTVDAFPNEKFQGKVGKIRLNASMTQNVVSYTVEVNIDNPGGRLLPYLTANVQFETARRDNVLMVPKAALRWTPPAELIKPDGSDSTPEAKPDEKPIRQNAEKGMVWTLADSQLRSVQVKVGISDDTDTEISGPEVRESMTVVTGIQENGNGQQTSGSANPFVPQFRFGRKR